MYCHRSLNFNVFPLRNNVDFSSLQIHCTIHRLTLHKWMQTIMAGIVIVVRHFNCAVRLRSSIHISWNTKHYSTMEVRRIMSPQRSEELMYQRSGRWSAWHSCSVRSVWQTIFWEVAWVAWGVHCLHADTEDPTTHMIGEGCQESVCFVRYIQSCLLYTSRCV